MEKLDQNIEVEWSDTENDWSYSDSDPVNEISEIVATTLDHDSDDNFSNTSDIIDYFKEEEGANDSIKRVLKSLK
ncbi:14599_t:CDS:2 [Funneliformis geosporum]|nr:14599_t:CDS:2 [Funneliformis geosporum]